MAKIFKGNSTSSARIMYTWDGKYLYQGNSTSSARIMYTFDSPIPVAIIFAVLD